MRSGRPLWVVGAGWLAWVGCSSDAATTPPPAPALDDNCARLDGLDALPRPASYVYDWSCVGEVEPTGALVTGPTPGDDCTSGIWPELDELSAICPTVSDVRRTDPVSGRELPSADPRPLPTEVPVSEAGRFARGEAPASYPSTLRVVTWNLEYTAHLDEQIAVLTSHPELSSGDVYLLSEVDRCSSRNGVRRAARLIAEALEADYVYGVEFVELDIGRDVGGDTGQAIVSRRPLRDARLSCHTSQHDWFASEEEPRLGQRVFLHAEIPAGDTSVRVYAVHLESNDLFGDLRSVQSKELLDDAQVLACERPQIMAGDFNAPYCGAPELEVLRDAGFVDAMGVVGDVGPTHRGGFRLDYVFAKGFRVIGGGVVRELAASDHDALWIDLELASSAP